ncbi:MAG: hypothetical protein KOO60_04280 [Gemmatimonadales bacterium]|nr:hypothetical protein [Gemmatimonadales bacterium]
MSSSKFNRPWVLSLVLALTLGAVFLMVGPAAAADFSATDRAAWLMDQINSSTVGKMPGQHFQKDEFGLLPAKEKMVPGSSRKSDHSPWLLLASAAVPGSGELLMGKWIRGLGLIAADAFCWYKAKESGDEGLEVETEYYKFARDNWSEDLLFEAYNPSSVDEERWGGIGLEYFKLTDDDNDPISSMGSVDNLSYLSLWVSEEDDEREYFENLGKWDQFVFGWNDFITPNDPPEGYEDFVPTGALSDLRQPWTSVKREHYRVLREKSNDAFKRQDRYMYFNIGLRLFSVLEVAYLQGWLGGADDKFAVAGHEVRILAEPALNRPSILAAQVSF